MARPQIEDGYLKLANEIVDQFQRLHLSPNEWCVLWAILRKTYGFNKKVDSIANSQICEATGLHKAVVSRTLKKLHDNNITFHKGKSFGLQKDWEKWGLLGRQQKLAESSTPSSGKKLTESSTIDSKLAESSTIESCQNRQQKLAESSTKVDSCNVTQKTKDKRQLGSPVGDPRIKEILKTIELKLGNQIPFYGKEGAAVKRALAMGFDPEQFIACWETMRGYKFWAGKWLPLAKVTENLTLFVKGELRDGALDTRDTKIKRVMGDRPPSDYKNGFWGGE